MPTGHLKKRSISQKSLRSSCLDGRANVDAMIMGAHILLGVTVLEKLDLMVDCNRHRLIPYQGTFDQPVFRV